MLKVVSIGGFGHSVFVFDDMLGMSGAELIGLSPAYEGEDISFFTSHDLCRDVPVYPDYHDMLTSLKPDVAIVSTRLDKIPEIVISVAGHGCHIIAEKPLALDLDTLDRVEKAVADNDIQLVAMLSMRSEPEFVAAKSAYDSGVIGEAVLVNGRKSYKYGTRPDWFAHKETYGGTIGWVGIHALDFTNFVTGLSFRRVAAMQGNFAHPERPACEDNCTLMLELSNGGHATISVDLFRPESAATHGDDWIRVVGTKGIIEARGSDHSCTLLINEKEPVRVDLPDKSKIFRDFLLSLQRGDSGTSLQNESFMLTRTCLLAKQAAEQSQVIDLHMSI